MSIEEIKDKIKQCIIYHADEKKYRYEIGKGVMDALAEDILKDLQIPELKSRSHTIELIRCKDCDHFRAQRLLNGEPLSYVCCRTNGYAAGREHYCAWAEQSLVPERYRYTAGCTSYYTEEREKNK